MDENLTLDQQKAEQVALEGKKVEDVRAEVIAEYSFDEAADADRIDKIVNKTLDNNKRLSQAIGQKIKHRTEAETLKTELSKVKPIVPENKQASLSTKSDLSSEDIFVLMEAKVPREDIDEVRDFASLKKISIAEALKSSIVRNTLSEKAEFRKTAEATAIGAARRSSAKATDETILERASQGKFPETDEEIDRLAAARQASKKKKS